MNRLFVSSVAACLGFYSAVAVEPGDDSAGAWPQWRGPLASGYAPGADPVLEWSEESNIRWKVPAPGKSHATPIVWGKRLFLMGVEAFGPELDPVPETAPGAHDNLPVTQNHRFSISALDLDSGETLWKTALRESVPHEGGHNTGSLAAASPITDGKRVYGHFGSYGLYALNLEGEILWERDFGRMLTKHAHGEGASPGLSGSTLVVNWDHRGDSFVIALDTTNGETRWKKERDEVTSWSTPLIVEVGGKKQVITSATRRIRAYDLETGDLVWECGGMPNNVVSSPVESNGILVAGASYVERNMLAIRLGDASGDITNSSSVVWSTGRLTPYVPSPLVIGNDLYFVRHNQNVFSHLDIETGKTLSGPYRLPGLQSIFASPVSDGEHIFVAGRMGSTLILKRGAELEAVALNSLDDQFSASPVLVKDSILLRGERFVYHIGAVDGGED